MRDYLLKLNLKWSKLYLMPVFFIYLVISIFMIILNINNNLITVSNFFKKDKIDLLNMNIRIYLFITLLMILYIFVISLINFYRCFFGREALMMMSAPVKKHTHITANIKNFMLWFNNFIAIFYVSIAMIYTNYVKNNKEIDSFELYNFLSAGLLKYDYFLIILFIVKILVLVLTLYLASCFFLVKYQLRRKKSSLLLFKLIIIFAICIAIFVSCQYYLYKILRHFSIAGSSKSLIFCMVYIIFYKILKNIVARNLSEKVEI